MKTFALLSRPPNSKLGFEQEYFRGGVPVTARTDIEKNELLVLFQRLLPGYSFMWAEAAVDARVFFAIEAIRSAFQHKRKREDSSSPQSVDDLCTVGRLIRWSSTGAEYGLFEATIVAHRSLTVENSYNGSRSDLYTEQLKEICLTENEARGLNLGFPS